eukprot:5939289-Pyramimonas_sp.AAC.1
MKAMKIVQSHAAQIAASPWQQSGRGEEHGGLGGISAKCGWKARALKLACREACPRKKVALSRPFGSDQARSAREAFRT